MSQTSESSRGRLSDSPWFWVALFAAVGLAALLVIGPKHLRRQQRLVRMQNARVNAAARSALENPQHEPLAASAEQPELTVLPLAVVFGLILAIACAGLLLARRTRSRNSQPAEKDPP